MMTLKFIPGFLLFIFSLTNLFAQKETFDITTYTPPSGWKKKSAENSVQFTREDAAKGTYCIITLFKAAPGTADSKENFDLAWTSLVKEMVTAGTRPEMQPAATENGWEVQSGYAAFEKDGNKGIVLLITSSGFEQMVNIVVLTNTDAYEKNIAAFLESVSLKKPPAKSPVNTGTNKPEKFTTPSATVSNGFAFTTTNFDDGWTSTVKEDWVETTKGDVKVLIHYPNKNADAYNSVLLDGLKNAWDVLVAPNYSSATNFAFKPVQSWQSIEFAEADCAEKNTGKTVHVVLFKKNFSGGNGKYLVFITADKKSFEQEFGVYNNDAFDPMWDKMATMANYNKFGVAASDLNGKWTTNFTGIQQYVNAYTGASAGMDTHSSSENFEFTGTAYKWDIAVANGFVGNIKFQHVKSSGKFSVPGAWQVNCSDIEGKPRTYNAFFSCIKGARVLWLDSTGFAKSE
jgi:hypothetical protein